MRLIRLLALFEGATGIALAISPALVTGWLVGEGVSGAGIALGRVAGFALLALGMACWPERRFDSGRSTVALFTYNVLVMVYLAYLGAVLHMTGALLWPAVAVHIGGALITAATLRRERRR
jgi:hypothetical protein